jgi:predicted acetyltransferase
MKIKLRYPTLNDLEELKVACLHPWALEWGFVHYFDSILNRDCEKLTDFLPPMANGIGIPAEHVPCTFMFAFNGHNKILGRVSIRHELTEHLENYGGHVGYGVLPEYRNRGVATEILRQSLEICKNDIGLSEVLITCDDDNLGSIKTIEKNAGTFIDKVSQEDGQLTRRYKIQL